MAKITLEVRHHLDVGSVEDFGPKVVAYAEAIGWKSRTFPDRPNLEGVVLLTPPVRVKGQQREIRASNGIGLIDQYPTGWYSMPEYMVPVSSRFGDAEARLGEVLQALLGEELDPIKLVDRINSGTETEFDTIRCEACGKEVEVETLVGEDSRSWVRSPLGWFSRDSYPPGDLGTLWACSAACLGHLQADPDMW